MWSHPAQPRRGTHALTIAKRIDDALARFWAPHIAAEHARGMHAWREGARMVVRDPRFARHHGHTRGETCAPH